APASPGGQALVLGRDGPLVGGVDAHLPPVVAGRDLPRRLCAVIGRGVVDNEHAHIDARLVIQHAADGVLEEMTVFVARDDDTNRSHRPLSGSRGWRSAGAQAHLVPGSRVRASWRVASWS